MHKGEAVADVYEIWDVETGNLVGAYDTPNEALTTVNRTLVRYGEASIRHFALGYEDDDGVTHRLAEGDDLARWAKRAYGSKHGHRSSHRMTKGAPGRGVTRLLGAIAGALARLLDRTVAR
jgi:hypothetical protein